MNCIIFGKSERNRIQVWLKLKEYVDLELVAVAEHSADIYNLINSRSFDAVALAEPVSDEEIRSFHQRCPGTRIIRFEEVIASDLLTINEARDDVA